MAVFVVLLLVPIMMQYLVTGSGYINYEQKNQRALAFFFIFVTILLMLRHESVGNDTRNYIYHFNLFANMGWGEIFTSQKEIGYAIFNKLIAVIFREHQIFFALVAIACSVMIYNTYKRLCLNASLTMVLYCILPTFVMMFSGLRQMLAIGIGFVAYECTRNKKPVHFVLAVILAISFHTSAFMLFFMYPIYCARITKKWLYAVVPLMVGIFIFSEAIFLRMALIAEYLFDYEVELTETGAYTMLILFAMFAVLSFLIPDETLVDDETRGLRNFLLFSVVLQMLAPLHQLAMRLNYYYIIFIPLLLPMIIRRTSEKWRQVAVAASYVMLIFFFGYFFISIQSESNLNVFPYHFFWENVG